MDEAQRLAAEFNAERRIEKAIAGARKMDSSLEAALKEWRNAKAKYNAEFLSKGPQSGGKSCPPDIWDRLVSAENKLYELSRKML